MKTARDSVWRQRLAGGVFLAGLSFRRLIRSRQTLVSGMLLGFAVLATLAWSLRRDRIGQRFPEPGEFTEQKKLIEQILIPIYVSFLLPVFCLCFGTASIAGDRDERTLAYLLVSPLPRPLIYTAKY